MSDIFKFDFNLDDVDDVCDSFDLYDRKAIQAASQAMAENTEALLGKSMRIVPHDEGMLEGSGSARVQNVEIAHGTDEGSLVESGTAPMINPGATITGTVSYNKPYAARQHEELSYEHKEGRQAKYLETPLKEFVREFVQNIADAVRSVRR